MTLNLANASGGLRARSSLRQEVSQSDDEDSHPWRCRILSSMAVRLTWSTAFRAALSLLLLAAIAFAFITFPVEKGILLSVLEGIAPNDHQPKFSGSMNMKETKTAAVQSQIMHSVSISMPSSPVSVRLYRSSRVLFKDQDGTDFNDEIANPTTSGTKQAKFHSQPMPAGSAFDEAAASGLFPNCPPPNPRIDSLNDKTFEPFKTRSCRFERKLSYVHGKPQEIVEEVNKEQNVEMDTLPVHRYFDALEGPELDTLRASEEILLPEDQQWPFLLRFPINSFGICLGVGSQAILWKNLATSPSTKFLHVSLVINLVLWCIAVALVSVVFVTYMLKVTFYFEAVRREYYHPIRVNYFFAPWVAILFVVLGVPPSIAQNIHTALWYILMTPIFCLEVKIYGEWMSGGQRKLSKVANPSTHVSIAGNFVGAYLGASMGLKEGPIFFFAVGLVHYAVLFVTLYQRLPTNETLPKELHPVFFLFVASPCMVSVAWARIQGSFDYGARIAYFISLFLYFSLDKMHGVMYCLYQFYFTSGEVVRFNFFRGFRFSLAWWAYTFPTTAAAIATIKYSIEVPNAVTKSLSVLLSAISTVVDISVIVMSILHAFVLHDLFPNDIAIAISDQRPKAHPHEWFHRRTGSSNKDSENFLKFTSSNGMDIEASMMPPSTIPTGFDNSGTIEVLCHVSQLTTEEDSDIWGENGRTREE